MGFYLEKRISVLKKVYTIYITERDQYFDPTER